MLISIPVDRSNSCVPVVLQAGVLLLALSCAWHPVYAQEITVARYSVMSVDPTPAQLDPLSALVDEIVTDTVTTVGEAVHYLLAGSGYRLSDSVTAPMGREALLALPLPDVHRDIGLVSRRAALEVLASPGFILVEDPIHRLVSFKPCRPNPSEPSGE